MSGEAVQSKSCMLMILGLLGLLVELVGVFHFLRRGQNAIGLAMIVLGGAMLTLSLLGLVGFRL